MKEKYGFVYIWYNKNKKKYYIGCHWGSIDDGYICSSKAMRMSYLRHPEYFKRRILVTNISDRKQTLIEEYRYLQMIKKEELGKKYYNLQNNHFNHWSTLEENLLTLPEKMSIAAKKKFQNKEFREKYDQMIKNRNNRSSEPEVREKRRKSMIGKNKNKDMTKCREASVLKLTGSKHTKEHIQKIKDTTIFKDLNKKKIKCNYCEFIGNPGNIGRYHNDKCKQKSG